MQDFEYSELYSTIFMNALVDVLLKLQHIYEYITQRNLKMLPIHFNAFTAYRMSFAMYEHVAAVPVMQPTHRYEDGAVSG